MRARRAPAFGVAETLLASMIIAMVVLGLYGIGAASARASQTNAARIQATAMAEESIEQIRYERELFWRGAVGEAPRDALHFWHYLQNNLGAGIDTSTGSLVWGPGQPVGGLTAMANQGGPLQLQRTLMIGFASPDGRLDGLRYIDPQTGTRQNYALQAGDPQVSTSVLTVTVTVTWNDGGSQSYTTSTLLTDWIGGVL